MKKTLASLALAGTFFSSVAAADAQVYGSVEQILKYFDTPTGNYYDVVQTGSSYLGVKATEDLGDGYSAYYNTYIKFKNEANDDGQFMFDNYIGFGAPWGDIKVGRFNSLTKQAGENYINQFEIGNHTTISEGWVRNNNSIAYTSPKFSGLQFEIENVLDGAAGKSGADITEMAVHYTNGPVKASITRRDDKVGNDEMWVFGMRGQVTENLVMNAAYETLDNNDGTATVNSKSIMGNLKVDGNNYIKAGNVWRDEADDILTLEGQHFFSKTTSVYLVHQINTPETGGKTKMTGLGMRMKF